MKILYLVDKYYPESSANTVCSEVIIDYLRNKDNKVDILSIKQNLLSDDISMYKDSNVIKIPTYTTNLLKRYYKVFHADRWSDVPVMFRKSLSFVQKVTHKPKYNTQSLSLDSINYNDVFNLISKVNSHYDVIISSSMPFGLHVLARELLKLGLASRWYAIFFDPFVYNSCLKKSKIKYRKKIAEDILNDASHIFCVERIVAENKRRGYNPNYHNKITEIVIPNLAKPSVDIIKPNNSNISMTFAGLFYPKIRNPQKMLDIISTFPDNFCFNIYGHGCEKILKKYKNKFNRCSLNLCGSVTYVECRNAILKSNILVNLSNTVTNQIPSKVFEYISYGKPIINFYFTEDDPSLQYFKKYPLVYNLNLNNYTDGDIKRLISFCETHKNDIISFEEATFKMQDAIAMNICKKILEILIQ